MFLPERERRIRHAEFIYYITRGNAVRERTLRILLNELEVGGWLTRVLVVQLGGLLAERRIRERKSRAKGIEKKFKRHCLVVVAAFYQPLPYSKGNNKQRYSSPRERLRHNDTTRAGRQRDAGTPGDLPRGTRTVPDRLLLLYPLSPSCSTGFWRKKPWGIF